MRGKEERNATYDMKLNVTMYSSYSLTGRILNSLNNSLLIPFLDYISIL